MKMTITDTDSGYRNLIEGMLELHGAKVMLGYHERINVSGTEFSVLKLAALSEFGNRERGIPEAGSLRMVFDETVDEALTALGAGAAGGIVAGESVESILDKFGKSVLDKSKDEMAKPDRIHALVRGQVSDSDIRRALRSMAEYIKVTVEKK